MPSECDLNYTRRENLEHEKMKEGLYKMLRFTKSMFSKLMRTKDWLAEWVGRAAVFHSVTVTVSVSLLLRDVLAQFYQISIIRGTLQHNIAATVPQKHSKHCPQQQLKCYAILETLWELLATPMAWCQFRHSCDRLGSPCSLCARKMQGQREGAKSLHEGCSIWTRQCNGAQWECLLSK